MAKEDVLDKDEENKDSSEVDDESQDESQEDKGSEASGEDSEGDDDDSQESESDSSFKKRFPQLKGENLEEYTQRLEDAYEKSTQEGKRLATENETLKEEQLENIANKDDDSHEQSTDESFGDKYAKSEVRRRNREAFDKFVEEHGELQTDPALAQRMKQEVGILAKARYESAGEVPDMAILLRGAWAMVNPQSSNIDARSDIKERTGMSKTSGAKKRETSSQFTPEQIAQAKRVYPGKSEKELVALLSKYTK